MDNGGVVGIVVVYGALRAFVVALESCGLHSKGYRAMGIVLYFFVRKMVE